MTGKELFAAFITSPMGVGGSFVFLALAVLGHSSGSFALALLLGSDLEELFLSLNEEALPVGLEAFFPTDCGGVVTEDFVAGGGRLAVVFLLVEEVEEVGFLLVALGANLVAVLGAPTGPEPEPAFFAAGLAAGILDVWRSAGTPRTTVPVLLK